MLPNLIIIGAAKAGTTSLHYYLGLHPDIRLARVKELNFFSHDDQWQRGAAWYSSQFGDAVVRTEASPSYTSYPRYADVPMRMHAVVPQARLLYIVRDPVERAFSNYVFTHADGREPRPLEEALTAPGNIYVSRSRYWMQIEQFLRCYDRSQIAVIAQEDLRRDLVGTLSGICRFLGVADPPDDPRYAVRLNESRDLRQKGPVARRLARLNNTRLVQALPMSFRLSFGRALYRPFSSPMVETPLDDRLRQYLVDQLSPDAEQFRAFTGRRFEDWTI